METFLQFLFQFSPWTAMLVGSVLFVLMSLGLSLAISRIRAPKWQDSFKAMYPPLCASLMVAYAIFAVIVANASWRNHENANHATRDEFYALERLVNHMQQEDDQGRELVRQYVQAVAEREWHTMADGDEHPDAAQTLVALRKWAMQPSVPYVNEIHSRFIQDAIRDLGGVRDLRLSLSQDSIPDILWFALMVSALAVLIAVAMAHAHNRRASLIMCALYGAVMGTVLTTMVLLDHPYSGPLSVTPENILDVRDLL